MDIFQAAGLGILQGLTEFLPISSSGHLVLAQSLIPNFSQPGVLFDAVLHAGTMFAVIIFFWGKIKRLTREYLILLLIGTIPAGLAGVLFQRQFEGLFSNPRAVGAALILTGMMNWMVDLINHKTKITKHKSRIRLADSLFIGMLQAVAIIPGISRSGATIFAGVWRGIGRQDSAVFSFLLSIPAISGATGWQILTHSGSLNEINLPNYLMGAVFAGVFGFVSISLLLRLLVTKQFRLFSLYCFLIGGLALLFL